jgi:hypothetical protein
MQTAGGKTGTQRKTIPYQDRESWHRAVSWYVFVVKRLNTPMGVVTFMCPYSIFVIRVVEMEVILYINRLFKPPDI